jgi:hypothetical protein
MCWFAKDYEGHWELLLREECSMKLAKSQLEAIPSAWLIASVPTLSPEEKEIPK